MSQLIIGFGSVVLFLPWLVIISLPILLAILPICIGIKKLYHYVAAKEKQTVVLPILAYYLTSEQKAKLKASLKNAFDNINTIRGQSFVSATIEKYQGFYSGHIVGTCSEGSFSIKALGNNQETVINKLISKLSSAKINFPGNLDKKIPIKKFLDAHLPERQVPGISIRHIEI